MKIFIEDEFCGLRNTQFLPLATSCEVRKPINDENILSPYKCFISFVGQSLSNEKRMSIKEVSEIKENKEKYSHIANSARNGILKKHTIKHRIDVILQALNISKYFQ